METYFALYFQTIFPENKKNNNKPCRRPLKKRGLMTERGAPPLASQKRDTAFCWRRGFRYTCRHQSQRPSTMCALPRYNYSSHIYLPSRSPNSPTPNDLWSELGTGTDSSDIQPEAAIWFRNRKPDISKPIIRLFPVGYCIRYPLPRIAPLYVYGDPIYHTSTPAQRTTVTIAAPHQRSSIAVNLGEVIMVHASVMCSAR